MVAKKRLLAGLASLTVMGIALAGCGSSENNSSNTPKDEKVTITYMHRLPDKEGMTLVNDIVAKWNKDNPNIQVKATKFDGAAQDMIKKLATSRPAPLLIWLRSDTPSCLRSSIRACCRTAPKRPRSTRTTSLRVRSP